MRIYAIQQHEMDAMRVLESQRAAWCSVAASAAVLAVHRLWRSWHGPGDPNAAPIASAILCAVAAAVAFAIARRFCCAKRAQLRAILQETELADRREYPFRKTRRINYRLSLTGNDSM